MLYHGICTECGLEQELLLDSGETPVCLKCKSTNLEKKLDEVNIEVSFEKKSIEKRVGEYNDRVQETVAKRDQNKQVLRDQGHTALEKVDRLNYKPVKKEHIEKRKFIYNKAYKDKEIK